MIKVGANDVTAIYRGATSVTKAYLGTTLLFDTISYWTPADTTTALWIDFSDESSLTLSGTDILAVTDKSNDLQGDFDVVNTSPTWVNTHNSLKVATFATGHFEHDGTNSAFNFLHDGTTPYTVYFQLRPGDVTEPNTIYAMMGNQTGTQSDRGTNFYFDDRGSVSRDNTWLALTGRGATGLVVSHLSASNEALGNVFQQVNFAMDPGNGTVADRSIIRTNGGAPDQNNTGNTTPSLSNALAALRIGAVATGAAQYVGDIAEIVVVKGAHSDAHRQRMEGYLAWKWGTEGSLPGGHPYENEPPLVQPLWTPAESSTDAWWDAADTSTHTIVDTNRLQQCDDKSGNNDHAIQNTSSWRPVVVDNAVNGLRVFRWDGNYRLDFVVPKTTTQRVYAVLDTTNLGTGYRLFLDRSNGAACYLGLASGNQRPGIFDGADKAVQASAVQRLALFAWALDDGAGNCATEVDAQTPAVSSVASTAGNWDAIGNASVQVLRMDMCEVIIASTEADQDEFEGYLAWKWGIEANLPSGHPYENEPPFVQPPWTPADITTELWLDADDASTLTYDGGNLISDWNDKSGNTRHATQSADAQKPSFVASGINSLGSVSFNSDSLSMSLWAQTLGHRIYAVIDTTNLGTGSRIFMLRDNGSAPAPYLGKGLDDYKPAIFWGTWYALGPATQKEALYMWDLNDGSGNATTEVDAQNTSTQAAPTTPLGNWSGICNPSTQQAVISVGEIVVVDGASSDDHDKIEGYLAHKWGLDGALPGGHPYKNAPP